MGANGSHFFVRRSTPDLVVSDQEQPRAWPEVDDHLRQELTFPEPSRPAEKLLPARGPLQSERVPG